VGQRDWVNSGKPHDARGGVCCAAHHSLLVFDFKMVTRCSKISIIPVVDQLVFQLL